MKGIEFFPQVASTIAPSVDKLFFFLVALTIFFTVVLYGLIIYFSVKFRRKEENEIGRDFQSLALEISWTVAPIFLVLFIFYWGVKVYFMQVVPPEDSIEYQVVGKQWMWYFQHPNGKREINELHVPKGQNIVLKMISQDVIHSFFVPAFRIKRDVLPGRYTVAWFNATKKGKFHLFCAEYCGLDHSRMIGRIIVMEPEEYELWLEEGSVVSQKEDKPIPPEEKGKILFGKLGCGSCHRAEDSPLAPSLVGKYGTEVELSDGSTVKVDDDYLRESILDSQAKIVKGYNPIMPVYAGQLSEEDVMNLVAYIKSLGASEK